MCRLLAGVRGLAARCSPCSSSCLKPRPVFPDPTLALPLTPLCLCRALQVYQLARETAVLLLECNPDVGPLLDWVVDRCYTGSPGVADSCFLALAAVFSAR